MLNYEEFKEEVRKNFARYMPKKYQGMSALIKPVEKVNRLCDALYLNEGRVRPIVLLDEMYEQYTSGESFDGVLEDAAKKMIIGYEQIPIVDVKRDKRKITFQLVNTEQNKKTIADIPHREFNDLSIIYRYIMDSETDNIQSFVITNKIAEVLKLDEKDLYNLAMTNTKKLFPPAVYTMQDLLAQMGVSGIDLNTPFPMYIITNKHRVNGAASILYDEVLYDLANKLDTNLYLLPSSIHEVIAIPFNPESLKDLEKMVCDININEVDVSDRLSNAVYVYDKEARKLSLANKYLQRTKKKKREVTKMRNEIGMFVDIQDLAINGARSCVVQNRRSIMKGKRFVSVVFSPKKDFLKAYYMGEEIYNRKGNGRILDLKDLETIYDTLNRKGVFRP